MDQTNVVYSDDLTLAKWQDVLNALAEITNVPVALIMRVDGDQITVHVASQTDGNPYKQGDSESLVGSGLYCEYVIKHRRKLLIPNALVDPDWKDNPDIKLNMISYLGFPLFLPDGSVFGTICILDNKENNYSSGIQTLMEQFKRLIETDFQLITERNNLKNALEEIRQLQSLLPICAHCKKIRNEEGLWKQIEGYLMKHHKILFTHTICSECAEKFYPELSED